MDDDPIELVAKDTPSYCIQTIRVCGGIRHAFQEVIDRVPGCRMEDNCFYIVDPRLTLQVHRGDAFMYKLRNEEERRYCKQYTVSFEDRILATIRITVYGWNSDATSTIDEEILWILQMKKALCQWKQTSSLCNNNNDTLWTRLHLMHEYVFNDRLLKFI
jgi:hypothetical protein